MSEASDLTIASGSPTTGSVDTHRKSAVRAGTIVIAGFGLSQIVRLGGNLVLTRLLYPELFALVAIAHVVTTGIGMLSDIGVGPAIIRSTRANDERFLNTAWTLQVIRGLALALIATALAIPISVIYEDPQLARIIPVIAIGSIVDGFRSTSVVTLEKDLKQGMVTILDLASQVASLIVMLIIAYIYRNVWGLVVGGLVGRLVITISSHIIYAPSRNRFAFDSSSARELLGFGKWIVLSTALSFFATQADRLLLGRLFALSFFGVYSIALGLAELPKGIMLRITSKVLYPLYSKYQGLSHAELRERIQRQRRYLILPLALLIGTLGSLGDFGILLLYDSRYADGAWIFPALIVGMWPMILHGTIDRVLYVIGKPNIVSLGNLLKLLYMVVMVPLAYRVGGNVLAVIVVALNDIPVYIAVAVGLRRERLSLFMQDMLATAALVGTIGVGLGFRLLLAVGMPWDRIG